MSSSQPFRDSSPIPGTSRRKSNFTYRHLSQLAAYNTSCPLRVIAHIDLDAFYAQCEMVRLGVPKDQPLAVQQWQGLIAVNYPAREHGIGRHCTLAEAKKKCPTLIAQHVATWREGEDRWAYRDDAAAHIQSDKVSLDSYRLESRKILAVIKESLPQELQKVEKASIDEVFLDLSAQVHSVLLERFPELGNPPPYDDPTESLPRPSVVALDWKADALIDLNEEEESVDPDWDDVAILIGSEIVRGVRSQILEKLQYTCSGGIAKNKLLSKLGSGHKKPNQQTVIRNRAVDQFLSDFKFTKIRNLGGKLGENVVTTFNTDAVSELLTIPLDEMKTKLGHDTGTWVYNTIRGIDTSEVNSRTQIKSMLSAKSFRPYIDTPEQACRWLRIFVADIFARLVEEGVLENKRRPRTINLHHRHAGQTKSRQAPIPQGRALDEQTLFDLAKNLLNQIIAEGSVWPCANLSLSVGGFEDGVTGNRGIGAFLLKGDEAQALKQGGREASHPLPVEDKPAKRRRMEGGSIHRFFTRDVSIDNEVSPFNATADNDAKLQDEVTTGDPTAATLTIEGLWDQGQNSNHQRRTTPFVCSRCNTGFETPEEHQSHEDWHFAKDLQEEERGNTVFANRTSAVRSGAKTSGASAKRGGGRGGKLEQGQSRLKFG
ncbi:sister chromatid cohesion protein eso1 [Colletotrichum truncatum]|uniref:Sister chromatid cohesion protein eso1 n=1 Tax=Colletotrichum truncatum TaxID=5467 RepID=A0ACC3Z1E5_COLTU|nr:sister chromatid cohesion protein eso1 [Colletotrichum truncatum]KAF6788940.1 sister chromatid cohesion protein eso1 [Colletotrichum truncatum]